MNNKSFDTKRIAEGYVKRPWLHKGVIEQIKNDCNIKSQENGLDVGCGAGLSTKELRITTKNSGVYEFGADDIVKGSGYISSQCCGNTEIELGTVYSSEMGITLLSNIDMI